MDVSMAFTLSSKSESAPRRNFSPHAWLYGVDMHWGIVALSLRLASAKSMSNFFSSWRAAWQPRRGSSVSKSERSFTASAKSYAPCEFSIFRAMIGFDSSTASSNSTRPARRTAYQPNTPIPRHDAPRASLMNAAQRKQGGAVRCRTTRAWAGGHSSTVQRTWVWTAVGQLCLAK